mgnify:CR=1 FL=1
MLKLIWSNSLQELGQATNLNTSHVKVNPLNRSLTFSATSYLNTSHVKVNQKNRFDLIALVFLFKYISC